MEYLPLDTEHKLNVLCTFNLSPMSRGYFQIYTADIETKFEFVSHWPADIDNALG